MKVVQWVRDLFDAAKAYTGPPGEVRIDSTNWNLRLHDGSTPGGHVILNQEQMDVKYQPASGEIAGITGFGPTDKGWLVRKGTSSYVLRTLQVNPNAEIGLTNGDGFSGDPTFTLGDDFQNLKIFHNGIHVVTGDVDFDHNLNVDGNLTLPTGTLTGNVDVSAKTLTLAANQILASKIDSTTLIALIRTYGCPIGAMLMWNTNQGAIPAGWAPCDGGTYNGIVTPNLRDKFIVGAGSTYANATTGGATSNTPAITIAGHSLTVGELAIHDHNYAQTPHAHAGSSDTGHAHGLSTLNGYIGAPGAGSALAGGATVAQKTPGSSDSGNAALSIAADVAAITFTAQGSGTAHGHPGSTCAAVPTLPPYYAQYFIMHVGP